MAVSEVQMAPCRLTSIKRPGRSLTLLHFHFPSTFRLETSAHRHHGSPRRSVAPLEDAQAAVAEAVLGWYVGLLCK